MHFVSEGLKHLEGKEMWVNHFELALDLHGMGAVAEQVLGNHDSALQYCDAIMSQEQATPLQKCRVYKVKLDVMLCQNGASQDPLN